MKYEVLTYKPVVCNQPFSPAVSLWWSRVAKEKQELWDLQEDRRDWQMPRAYGEHNNAWHFWHLSPRSHGALDKDGKLRHRG